MWQLGKIFPRAMILSCGQRDGFKIQNVGWLQGVYFRVFFLLSRKLTYPPTKACLKMIFLVPRWDMSVSWRLPPPKTWRAGNVSPIFVRLKNQGFSAGGAGPGGFLAEVVLFLCETQAFLRSERRTDVALDSNQASGTTRTRFKALVQFERPPKGYGGFGRWFLIFQFSCKKSSDFSGSSQFSEV